MKTNQVLAFLAPAAVAQAQWWGGAAQCAQGCMSSHFSDPTNWPAPNSICATATPVVGQCIQSACQATPTAAASFTSISSSLCAQWASCTANGGDKAVRTLTATADGWAGGFAGPGGFGPGFGGQGFPGGKGGPFGGANSKRDWPHTLKSGQVYTVTGCDWNNGVGGGPAGWGWGGQGPWGWGAGWTAVATSTATVTRTFPNGVGGAAATVTTTGPVTIGVAASGSVTTTATLGFINAEVTGSSNAGRNAAANGAKVVGAVLGGVVGVAAML